MAGGTLYGGVGGFSSVGVDFTIIASTGTGFAGFDLGSVGRAAGSKLGPVFTRTLSGQIAPGTRYTHKPCKRSYKT